MVIMLLINTIWYNIWYIIWLIITNVDDIMFSSIIIIISIIILILIIIQKIQIYQQLLQDYCNIIINH